MKKLNKTFHPDRAVPWQMIGNNRLSFQSFFTIALIGTILFAGCRKNNLQDAAGTGSAAPSRLTTNSTTGDFTIAVIPDPQYMVGFDDQFVVAAHHHVTLQMWQDEIDWIINNKASENIVYVAGLGDVVDCGDDTADYNGTNGTGVADEWTRASTGGMYKLEAAGIPYGVAVGNHEEFTTTNNDLSLPTYPMTNFKNYFGYAHFAPFKYTAGGVGPDATHYYGGAVDNSGTIDTQHNRNHYDLFNAGGIGFIVIYLEYDTDNNLVYDANAPIYNWAYNLMGTYASRKVIVVTHYAGRPSMNNAWNLGPDGITYNDPDQATLIYNKLKARPNFFMFLGGHQQGAGFKQIMNNGRSVKVYITDYQDKVGFDGTKNGGSGYLRLMKFSVANDNVSVRTFSPYIMNNPGLNLDSAEMFAANTHFQRPLFHDPVSTRTTDFSNDGKTDLAFFNAGTWRVNTLANSTYGQSGDIPTPADYNGDGMAEHSVFRPSDGRFYVEGPTPDMVVVAPPGSGADIPVPGDYNGDGRGDFAVYRPSNGTWYTMIDSIYADSQGNFQHGYRSYTHVYGNATDIPVPGNYLGDGHSMIAVYRPSTFDWLIRGYADIKYGYNGDIPVPGDYNGDGKTDIAVYRTSTALGTQGHWYIVGVDGTNLPNINPLVTFSTGDIPAPGDYDGLGRTQPAVWRPSTKTLYIGHWGSFGSTTITSVTTVNYASYVSGDKLLNLPYHIRKFFFP